MKQKSIDTFKEILGIYEKRSTCARLKVAALLVKDDVICATGYNGVPSGMKHCNEFFSTEEIYDNKEEADRHHLFSESFEVHAEQALIANAAKHGVITGGCQLFVSVSPCSQCAKLIISCGITEVYYKVKYDRNTAGLDLLISYGIKCQQI